AAQHEDERARGIDLVLLLVPRAHRDDVLAVVRQVPRPEVELPVGLVVPDEVIALPEVPDLDARGLVDFGARFGLVLQGQHRGGILTKTRAHLAAAAIGAIALASPAAAQTTDAAAARERSAAVPVPGVLLLSGKPFPASERFASTPPAPRRTFFAAAGMENGD